MRKLILIIVSIVAAATAAAGAYAACAAGTPTNVDTGTTCTPQHGNTQCQYTKTST